MTAVRVVTDSTADIPLQIASSLGISIIPDQVIFGQKSYRDGVDITLDSFIELLSAEPHFPKTAQPGLGVFLETYRRLGHDGSEIVSIHVGNHLSGMVSTAQAAVAELAAEARVVVVDSQQLSMAQGWQVIAAARAAQLGAPFKDVIALAQQLPPLAHVVAMLDSLDHIRRSGRIGRLVALLGSALQIKPLFSVVDGRPVLVGNVRTRRKALGRLVEYIAAQAPFLAMAVLYTGSLKAATELADQIDHLYPRDRILVSEAGAAVATHLGPGAMGVCFFSDSGAEIDPDLFKWDDLGNGES